MSCKCSGVGVIRLQRVGVLRGLIAVNLNGEGGGESESGAGPEGVGTAVAAEVAAGEQAKDPCVILIHIGGAPGGGGPLPHLRLGDDAVILAELIQGQRGHLGLTGAVLLGAVEGGEVHRAGDDLIRVALGQRVQVDAVEMGAEGAGRKVVAGAKGVLDPLPWGVRAFKMMGLTGGMV